MRNIRSALRSSRPSTLMNSGAAVLGLAEVGGGAAGVDAGAREPAQRHAGSGHGLHDGGAAGSLVGRPEGEQHRGAAHDAAAQGQDEIRRHFAAGDGAEDQAEDHGDPAGAPPGAADPGRAKDDDGDAAGDPVRVDLGLERSPSPGDARPASSSGWPNCCTMPWSRAASSSCANRDAATSITNSLYRRRHSATTRIAVKMSEAMPWKIR